jgi:hypothetical protein
MLLEAEREQLIDYVARERAETWVVSGSDIEADIGWSSDNEDLWYHIARKTGISEWDFSPLDNRTDAQLIDYFLYQYDVDPAAHKMDALVTGWIFRGALALLSALAPIDSN